MKILIDENVSHDFRKILSGHDVSSVQYMGWSGVKNGKLLELAENHFDILLTLDTGLIYENNFSNRKIAVITLVSKYVKITDLMPLIPQLLLEISRIKPGKVVNIVQ